MKNPLQLIGFDFVFSSCEFIIVTHQLYIMISYSNSSVSNSIFEQFNHWHISEHTNPFFLQLQRKESQFVFLHEHELNSVTD